MHKRILEFLRLFPLVLLLVSLLVPSVASAAHPTGKAGPEQPTTDDIPYDIPRTASTPEFGYVYKVEAGDDVWLIAVAHGITMEELVAANNLVEPYWLQPGDKLWVPALPAVVKRKARPIETPAPPQPTPESAPAATPVPSPEANPASQPASPDNTTVLTTTAVVTAPSVVTATEPPPAEPTPAPEPTAPPEPPAAAVDQSASAGVPEWAATLLSLMNEKRVAAGRAALTWSAELAQAAQGHANDCAQRGWGSHTGSDGARLRTRLARVGYYGAWTTENWANASSAEHAFNMWFGEGWGGVHHDTIMNGNYAEVGIGMAQGGWGYYFIADFGSR